MTRNERKRLLQNSKGITSIPKKQITSINQQQVPLMNTTEEIFQITRVQYSVHDKDKLEKIFKKLKCMAYDAERKRWVWLYQAEAKKIKFDKSYKKLPNHLQPIVLGSFFIPTSDRAYLDLNSIERMNKAILFFDKNVSRTILSLVHVQVVNKLFNAAIMKNPKSNNYLDPNRYLDPNNPGEVSIDTELAKITEASTISMEDKQTLLVAHIEKEMQKPMAEVENHPINLYEDGNIQVLAAATKMRQKIAYEHFNGNKNYTMLDCMREIDNEQIIPCLD